MNRLDDLFALVRVESVSGHEGPLALEVERRLRGVPALDVERIGDNVVARTRGNAARRLLVAGHLDTVPGDPVRAQRLDDRVRGLGACDMKGSLAIMLELARDPRPRSVEVTWVFYAREEVARADSGLLEIQRLRPELLAADAAVVAEPTGGVVEAGCQGTMRVVIEMRGTRAHTARPYMGQNALHRLGEVLTRVASYDSRTVVIDGVSYHEQLQAVRAQAGVADNVVPDCATCTLNYRVAPDHSRDDAWAVLREFLGDTVGPHDDVRVVDWAPPAAPRLSDPLIQRLVSVSGSPARAKAGWTDVATFAEWGVPSANYGAGNPELAHHRDEFVTTDELDEFARGLGAWLA